MDFATTCYIWPNIYIINKTRQMNDDVVDDDYEILYYFSVNLNSGRLKYIAFKSLCFNDLLIISIRFLLE